MRKSAIWISLIFLGTAAFIPCDLRAESACQKHGGPNGCDKASNRVLCADGALDMNVPCPKKKKPKSAKRELKFKPADTHGQIVGPGEKPPASTIEQSQTDLSH